MEQSAQTTREPQAVPWADVSLRLAVANAMVEELPNYLTDEALERPITVQTDQGDQTVPLSGGALLAALHSLQGLREGMLLESKTLFDGIRTHFDSLQHELRTPFYEKLNREVQARSDQLEIFLGNCVHNPTSCRTEYAAVMRHRQIIEEIRKTLKAELRAEAAQHLATIDQRIQTITAEADFIWQDHWQALYPPKLYWYLYRLPVST